MELVYTLRRELELNPNQIEPCTGAGPAAI